MTDDRYNLGGWLSPETLLLMASIVHFKDTVGRAVHCLTCEPLSPFGHRRLSQVGPPA